MYVLPYSVIEKLVVSKSTQAAVIRLLLTALIKNSSFDEAFYLRNNPDVALAVERGEFPDGRSHFASYGYFEGRTMWRAEFSEEWYLRKNEDVRETVEMNLLGSGESHYYLYGMYELRSPSEETNNDLNIWRKAIRGDTAPKEKNQLIKNDKIYQSWKKMRTNSLAPTSVLVPRGAISPNGNLMIGNNGTVFQIGGQDSPIAEYGRVAEEILPMAIEVEALCSRRSSALRERGIKYIQIVIPEKLSVLTEDFPIDIVTPTTLLSTFENRVKASPLLSSSYVSCYDSLKRAPFTHRTYRTVDTHLSPYGAFILTQAILQHLSLKEIPSLRFDIQQTVAGDVSEDFLGLLEVINYCDDSWAADCIKRFKSRKTLWHEGKRQGWSCPEAPNQLRVLVYGTSYFEFAEAGQQALSWWMARVFSEYEFMWTTSLDWSIVDEFKPNLVICQTTERSLHRITNN